MRKQQWNEAEVTIAQKLNQGSFLKTGSNLCQPRPNGSSGRAADWVSGARPPARINHSGGNDVQSGGAFLVTFFRKKSDKEKQTKRTCPP
jgi:hypothetical protein